ncbi:MAG TPA: MFS transporter [Candidatus Acidoferrales bacterium]|nr:MFS transporter [Candidatus Acidoferrales bacterium]
MKGAQPSESNLAAIKSLTFLMFMMFAMTTDAVGVIIPEVIKEFHLKMTAAGGFQYATMSGIAFAGIFLGYLADKLGRKKTIILGLVLFALNSYLFAVGKSFSFFLVLLLISGTAIGIFKTGALALIGDITRSTTEHTATMNTVEGFFAVGAVIGPAIVAHFLTIGASWKWLYVIAGSICVVLILIASSLAYPQSKHPVESVDLKRTMRMLKNPYALGFSAVIVLYVAVESAVYVWMPTLLSTYHGSAVFVATYAISIFFVLRAAGRFFGAWMLARLNWATVSAFVSFAILACFVLSMVGGISLAVFLLPFSGLFMSVLYPTINSKGISCFPKAEHGAIAGVILFFTCGAAVVGPLAMGAISDRLGNPEYGFILATGFAGLLFVSLLVNWVVNPTSHILQKLDATEYRVVNEQETALQAER